MNPEDVYFPWLLPIVRRFDDLPDACHWESPECNAVIADLLAVLRARSDELEGHNLSPEHEGLRLSMRCANPGNFYGAEAVLGLANLWEAYENSPGSELEKTMIGIRNSAAAGGTQGQILGTMVNTLLACAPPDAYANLRRMEGWH